MNLPEEGDYIDIHTHGAIPLPGIFAIETLMAHEGRLPSQTDGLTFSAGIHPWYLNRENHDSLLSYVSARASGGEIIAVGEAGFDRLKGPDMDFQKKTFSEQMKIASENRLPVVIHCVKAWEELIAEHHRLKPDKPWLVHGFRGKKELALQLISRGIYLSFWFDYVTRSEATALVRSVPVNYIFLETDGSGADIKSIYKKVSEDLDLTTDELKSQIFRNFNTFFR